MKDDISEIITNAQCYTLNSQTSIYSYSNNTRITYTQIGGKWYKTAQQTYTNLPVNAYCVSYNTISDISSYNYYLPIYEAIALVLALFVWFFVFKLVSKFIRWKA